MNPDLGFYEPTNEILHLFWLLFFLIRFVPDVIPYQTCFNTLFLTNEFGSTAQHDSYLYFQLKKMTCGLNSNDYLWKRIAPFGIVILVIVSSLIIIGYIKFKININTLYNSMAIEADSLVKSHEMVYFDLELLKEVQQLKLQILSKW